MNYLKFMMGVLKFDTSAVKALNASSHLLYYSTANVMILGMLYGFFTVYFGQAVLVDSGIEATFFSPYKIVLTGVSVAFLMHGGAALFVWVFLRALGGNPNFMPAYLHIGVAGISSWPLVPFAVAIQAGAGNMMVIGISIGLTAYALAVNFVVLKTISGLSALKMTIAAFGAVVYVGCFLYLWM